MATIPRKVTWLFAVAAVIALLGCSSSTGEGDASTDPTGAGDASSDGAGEADVPGELDQRVVEAVVPVSGESMPSSRWLGDELKAAKLPQVSTCLEERGRLDLLPMVERQQDFTELRGWDPFLYPEPDLLLADGLASHVVTLPDEYVQGMLSGDGASDGGVVVACLEAAGEDATLTRIDELDNAVSLDWSQVVERVSYDDQLTPSYEEFALCLRADGVPDEVATGNPVDFIQWAEGQRMGLDEAEAQQTGRDQARLYVECGEQMFEARADLLRPEREVFLESHRDQIQELTELLVDLGVG